MSASKVPQAFPASRAHTLFVFIGFCQVFQSFRIQGNFLNYSFLGLRVAVQGFDGACSLEVAPTKGLGVSLSKAHGRPHVGL